MDERHYFTDEEREQIAKEIVGHALEMERLENEKKEIAKDYKSKIDAEEEAMMIKARQYHEGHKRQISND